MLRLASQSLRQRCRPVCRPARAACGPAGRLRARHFTAAAASAYSEGQTALGAYLEKCGATWGDATAGHEVVSSADGRSFSWPVDLPAWRRSAMRPGESVESPPFTVDGAGRARFQFFPKGDENCEDEQMCSLWLVSDSKETGSMRLRVGAAPEREGGASLFCKLADAMRDGDGDILQLEARLPDEKEIAKPQPKSGVVQSLQLTGLQLAEWRIYQAHTLFADARSGSTEPHLISSPPFRFHHVLLGDMYLEALPSADSELCTLFFRCRVPTMRLKVEISVGDAFSKSIISEGKNTSEQDLGQGIFLQVNMGAPGVVDADGSLVVRCALEEVVSIPAQLRNMMPRLDERALWPKRL